MAGEPDYRALYEEIVRKQKEGELELGRVHQAEKQTAQFIKLLQKELQERKDEVNPQSLQDYLVQVSRLQVHAIRLLPRPTAVQRSSHLQSASPSRPSGPQPTTSGRTDINKKYYPLCLRPWTDFTDVVQRGIFARIHAALQNPTQNGLPSRVWVQRDEETLLGQLPLQALNQYGALNANRTNDFLKAVLLTPASRVINQYLSSTLVSESVFFDTAVQAVRSDISPVSGSQQAASVGASGSDNARSAGSDSPRKVQPDCVVLAMATNDTLQSAEDDDTEDTPKSARRVAVGEHKPCHALRAASIAQIVRGPLAEDYVVRLARQALARRKKKKAAPPGGGVPEMPPASGLDLGSEPLPTTSSQTSKLDKQTYFAYALAQTYHYMLVSGVEYGYLATGEVIVFLRILEDDPATLYYHAALFPIPTPPTEGGSSVPQSVTGAPVSEAESVTEEALGRLPIAQMASFCELALRSTLRSSSWVAEATRTLAHFPELPSSLTGQHERRPPSVLGTRRRDDDDDDDHDGDGGRSNKGNRPSFSHGQLPSHGSHVGTPSPLQQELAPGQGPSQTHLDISTSFLSTPCELWTRPRTSHQVLKPSLKYCTQACLLGLVQNGPLDKECPNYALHVSASHAGTTEGITANRHALTQLELAQRIRDQLFDTPEVNCQYYMSRRGAVGYPFKLTLTNYGYTFVGKGVEEKYGGRLVHESKIYCGLRPLQGSLIPVHLGLIQLHVGYPVMSMFLQLPYMMLLSYAGESTAQVDTSKLAGIDLEAETRRTLRELAELGVDDEDNNVANVRWCGDVGRVMRIDFDRAYLLQNLQHSQTASIGAPETPTTVDVPETKETETEACARPAKRAKYDSTKVDVDLELLS